MLRSWELVSVICAHDPRLHLAPFEKGIGTSVHTLCLERWKDYAQCREDSELCADCVNRYRRSQKEEQ